MIQSNFSVLPFYKTVGEQHHRKSYAYGSAYPLRVDSSAFLPFQVHVAEASNASDIEVHLCGLKGYPLLDITAQMYGAGLAPHYFDDYAVLVFPAKQQMSLNAPPGQYYVKLKKGLYEAYSEVFTLTTAVDRCLKLEWGDQEDLLFEGGRVVYDEFKHRLFLDTQLGKPEYKFEEEGEERDGFFFPEKQLSEKSYKFTFLAPEYLLDALRIVRLSDRVIITDQFGVSYSCDTFLMTPTWQAQGDLASVEVEFETSTVIKKGGKGFDQETWDAFKHNFSGA